MTTLLSKGKPAAVKHVRLETIKEGSCVQMLHVGPYEREPETIEKMRAFAEGKGVAFSGVHHEIYLSAFRAASPPCASRQFSDSLFREIFAFAPAKDSLPESDLYRDRKEANHA